MYPLDTPGVINYPFPNIGEGYGICVSPYTHTSKGYASTAQEIQEKMAKRLVYKVTENLDRLVRVEKQKMEDAEFAVVAYGGNARPAMAAVEMAREKGMRVGFFRPIIVWPFPDEEVLKVAEKVKKHPGLRAEHRRAARSARSPGRPKERRRSTIWDQEA